MTIERDENSILDQIERLPQSENIEQIRRSVKLNFLAENLARQKADVEKVCATSEIKEERTFSKQDIAKLIVLFAMAHQLELERLRVSRIVRDEQGQLLVFEVEARHSDGGYQLISYIIKGRHGRNQSETTALDRTFWDKNDRPDGVGEIIAEYLGGKWHFET